MAYFSKSCPTCKRMLPMLCATCPQCDSRTDAARDADDSYNHMITLGMRISAVACGLVVAAAITSTGRKPEAADYKLMLVILAVSAGTIWGMLKATIGETRRSLWRTSLIPAFIIVACIFIVREVNGQRAAVMAETSPAIDTTAVVFSPSSAPANSKAPLSQVAGECFDFVYNQAVESAKDVRNANVGGMLDVDTADAAKARRAELTKLDGELREADERARKTATELTSRLQNIRPGSKSAATLVTAVRESAAELGKKSHESIAYHRRMVEAAQTVLNFLEPRAGRYSTKSRITVNNAGDTEAYERLMAEFDAAERDAATSLRNAQKQYIQAKRRIGLGSTR
jgi:hypothetical protein